MMKPHPFLLLAAFALAGLGDAHAAPTVSRLTPPSQLFASGEPVTVMTMMVAPLRLAMPAASIKSRVRPEFEITMTQSPGPRSDALITCIWPSLYAMLVTPSRKNLC